MLELGRCRRRTGQPAQKEHQHAEPVQQSQNHSKPPMNISDNAIEPQGELYRPMVHGERTIQLLRMTSQPYIYSGTFGHK